MVFGPYVMTGIVVELPHFTRTFTPVVSIITPDMTSLATSGRKLPREKRRKYRRRRLQLEFLGKGWSDDATNMPDATSLFASGRLQHATKYCHCLNQTHHADLVYSHARYDVTSYLRSAFIKVRKTAENATSDVFESNFSGAAFACPANWLTSCCIKRIV